MRANNVPGWMSVGELSWLEATAAGRDLVIEFGSWRGRSSIALAAARRLVCVDLFVDGSQEGGTGQDIYSDFLFSIGDDISRIETVRASLADKATAKLLQKCYGESADVVFIDASHDEESVRRDICTALSLVRDGGIVCGHDYSPAWPGVVSAVRDLLPAASLAAESIWWTQV